MAYNVGVEVRTRTWGWCGRALVTGLVACGSTSSGGDGTNTAGGDGNAVSGAAGISSGGPSEAGATSNGGSSPGGASQAGAGGATAMAGTGTESTAWTGTVQVGRLLVLPDTAVEASARFHGAVRQTGYDCESQKFADCAVSTCTSNGDTPVLPPAAGDIQLSDNKGLAMTLSASPDHTYPSVRPMPASLSGGEVMTIAATGGEVPAFSEVVAVPLTITLSSPALDLAGVATVPRNQDLSLAFDNRAADGETGTFLTVISRGSASVSLYCSFPSGPGTATIQAAALSALPPGTQLLPVATRTATVEAGDYTVSLLAYFGASNPDKSRGVKLVLE